MAHQSQSPASEKTSEAEFWTQFAIFVQLLTKGKKGWAPTPGLKEALTGKGSERLHAPLGKTGTPLHRFSVGQAAQLLADCHGSGPWDGGPLEPMKLLAAFPDKAGSSLTGYQALVATVIKGAQDLAKAALVT